jgi:hypothetical protein
MNKLHITLALIAMLVAADAAAQAGRGRINGRIPPEQAIEFVGREGTVCGKVEGAKHAQNSSGEPTFLYLGGAFPKHAFTVRIWGKNRAEFDPAPETLIGSVVCASGRIANASNRAEIVVNSPSELESI